MEAEKTVFDKAFDEFMSAAVYFEGGKGLEAKVAFAKGMAQLVKILEKIAKS